MEIETNLSSNVPGEKPLVVYAVDAPRFIGLALLYLGLLAFYYWGSIARLGFVLSDLVLILILLGLAAYRVVSLYLNRDLVVQVFEDRFVLTSKGQTQVIFWKNLDHVRTFRYDILSIIYVKYVRVTIEDTFGKKYILDRTLRKINSFEELVQMKIVEHQLPAILESLAQGGKYESGGFTLTKDALIFNKIHIPWNNLGKVMFWQGQVRIWEKGKRVIKIAQWSRNIPNFYLFLTVLEKMAEDHADSPDLEERNSSPK